MLVGSNGIEVDGEGGWNARKHGTSELRVWLENPNRSDEKSVEVGGAGFTSSDAIRLPRLFDHMPINQNIADATLKPSSTATNSGESG